MMRTALLPIGVGLVAALAAQLFVVLVVRLNNALLIATEARSAADPGLVLIATIVVPTVAGLLVGWVKHVTGTPEPQGPADVIAAVQTRRGLLPRRAGWASTATNLLSLGGGATVGEYGPLVHLGGQLGAGMGRVWRLDVTRINVAIACGVAAAISTVFNAPIAGILFAHEVVLRHFAPRAFAPVAIASITGYIVANAVIVREPLLTVAGFSPPDLWEFVLFVALGVGGAGLALAFMHAILGAERIGRRLRLPDPLKPALAGLGLGAAALAVPEVLGMGFELLRKLAAGESLPAAGLATILVLRLLATAMCLGLGFSGGTFGPAMVLGGLFGALAGLALHQGLGLPVADSAVYAICGMVAVTAPVIGAPVTAVVIVLELTGSYALTLAALAAVAISNFLVSRLFGRSLFDRQLRNRRIDLSAGRSKAILESRTIAPLVNDRYIALDDDIRVDAALERLAEAHLTQAFLIDRQRGYRGTVELKDLMVGGREQPARELRNRDEVVMLDSLSIWRAMQRLRRFDGESVAVVDDTGRLVGALYGSELITAYLDIQAELRGEEQIAPG